MCFALFAGITLWPGVHPAAAGSPALLHSRQPAALFGCSYFSDSAGIPPRYPCSRRRRSAPETNRQPYTGSSVLIYKYPVSGQKVSAFAKVKEAAVRIRLTDAAGICYVIPPGRRGCFPFLFFDSVLQIFSTAVFDQQAGLHHFPKE